MWLFIIDVLAMFVFIELFLLVFFLALQQKKELDDEAQ